MIRPAMPQAEGTLLSKLKFIVCLSISNCQDGKFAKWSHPIGKVVSGDISFPNENLCVSCVYRYSPGDEGTAGVA